MIPDYDFTLLFPPAARDQVFEGLKKLCDSKTDQALEEAKNKPDIAKLKVDLTLRACADMPSEIISAYPRLSDGEGCLGYVYLYVSPSIFLEFPDAIEYRLWPCTRLLQRACFGSMELRSNLVEMLKTSGGYAGYVVYESCIPVEFWHHERGRQNDNHPPEYAPQ